MLTRPIPKIFLFVPATRPERIAKAFASGADEVIADWEDTVAPQDKAAARANIAEYCRQPAQPAVWVRINNPRSQRQIPGNAKRLPLSKNANTAGTPGSKPSQNAS